MSFTIYHLKALFIIFLRLCLSVEHADELGEPDWILKNIGSGIEASIFDVSKSVNVLFLSLY